jgi:hypothetical protein
MDDSKLTVLQKSENMLFRHSGESRNPVLPLAGFQIAADSLNSGACPGPDPGSTGVTTFYKIIKIRLVFVLTLRTLPYAPCFF